jgi:hypothetical protein
MAREGGVPRAPPAYLSTPAAPVAPVNRPMRERTGSRTGPREGRPSRGTVAGSGAGLEIRSLSRSRPHRVCRGAPTTNPVRQACLRGVSSSRRPYSSVPRAVAIRLAGRSGRPGDAHLPRPDRTRGGPARSRRGARAARGCDNPSDLARGSARGISLWRRGAHRPARDPGDPLLTAIDLDRDLLFGLLALRGRPESCRKAREEAVEKLTQAVRLDPARAADRARLERIMSESGGWDE